MSGAPCQLAAPPLPPGWVIAPAGEADLPELVAVERACYGTPWSEAQFREELERPGSRLDLCRADGRLAGYHCWWLIGGELQVLNLATAPAFRRRQVALRLLVAAMEQARSDGARIALLEVRAGNAGAVALYRRCGFRPAGRRRSYYPDGEDALLMECALDRPFPVSGAQLPKEDSRP